jgi:hypothetical protein
MEFDVNKLSSKNAQDEFYAAAADGMITAEELGKFNAQDQKVLTEFFGAKPTKEDPWRIEKTPSTNSEKTKIVEATLTNVKKVEEEPSFLKKIGN